ncbi:MAG: hypothetical protein AB2L07_12505 [Thermoanaerobaculaceae bacterium]
MFARRGTYTPRLAVDGLEQDPAAANDEATMTVTVAGRARRHLGR